MYPSDRPITFTSDYKKVSLKKEDILYIESPDLVSIGNQSIPVSRKYKDSVKAVLAKDY